MINLGVIVLELGMCYSKLGEIHPTILLRVTKMTILLEGLTNSIVLTLARGVRKPKT